MENELNSRLRDIESRLKELEKRYSPNSETLKEVEQMNVGELSYKGKYESFDREIKATFSGDVSIYNILKINSKDLAQVIDAFSSEDRLDIVKLLLKKPLTAKEIMDLLNFPTTGKVYHHLSFLEKLGIISKNNEKFSISEKSVACIILMILGVSQIIEGRK